MQTEALREEALDASDIAFEVELGVEVRRGHHLRKVDHGHFFVLADHKVEFVEVSMDESMLCKLDDELDEAMVDLLRVKEASHVDHRVGPNQRHHDAVSVGVYWCRSGEASLMQSFHEGVLFKGSNPRHIEPTLRCSVLQVITVVLDRTE